MNLLTGFHARTPRRWDSRGERRPAPSVEPLQPARNAPPGPLPWDAGGRAPGLASAGPPPQQQRWETPDGQGAAARALPARATSLLVRGPGMAPAACIVHDICSH